MLSALGCHVWLWALWCSPHPPAFHRKPLVWDETLVVSCTGLLARPKGHPGSHLSQMKLWLSPTLAWTPDDGHVPASGVTPNKSVWEEDTKQYEFHSSDGKLISLISVIKYIFKHSATLVPSAVIHAGGPAVPITEGSWGALEGPGTTSTPQSSSRGPCQCSE